MSRVSCAQALFEKRGRGAANKTPVFLFRYAYSFSRRGYERSEVEFRYSTKATQESVYQKLLKLIKENLLKFN